MSKSGIVHYNKFSINVDKVESVCIDEKGKQVVIRTDSGTSYRINQNKNESLEELKQSVVSVLVEAGWGSVRW